LDCFTVLYNSQKRARSESSEDRGRQDRSVRGGGSRGGQQAIPPNSHNTAYTAPGSSRSSTATITHGRHQGEEDPPAAFLAEGMLETEATPASEAAATLTGEASLAEAGGGPGAAGRPRSPGSCRSPTREYQQSRTWFLQCTLYYHLCRLCIFFVYRKKKPKNPGPP
jgi:hypothetical protein